MLVTCRQLTEMVTDKKEGKLSSEQQAGYALHLSWCDRCRRYIQQMDLTMEAVKRLPDEPVPEEVRSALLARFRGHPGRPH
jgi:anti-sigma factor RsiW